MGSCTETRTGVRFGFHAPAVHTVSPPLLRAVRADVTVGRVPQPGPGGPCVIGRHERVCTAGQLGSEAIGPADADDPVPFVCEAEWRVSAGRRR
ncbi:phosphatase [Streptomyces marispadix]|uniref:Phosphatase n=1 Tax=Streptomyces marispadix TaxID=2922868 RepID=A0ABS9T049_9ACTN|nr:phosphatase [Streptomyces marispadix]MCH6161872.1 phosphatase [Streptomyces marispadix]